MSAIKLQLPSIIAANIEQFTGRTWLLPTLLHWYEQTNERLFLLTGEPGTGKSMIMAWLAGAGPLPIEAEAQTQLAYLRAQVKAIHFCIAASGTTDPKDMARQMAEQLTRHVPGFGKALTTTLGDQVQIVAEQQIEHVETGSSVTVIYIGSLNLGNLSEELSFNRILRDPLKQLYADGYDQPMLLLVDALDEAMTYSGTTNIVHLLTKLTDLPQQVRFLVTTRPDPRVLMLLSEAQSFDLIKDAPQDIDDVQQYVLEQLAAKDGLEPAQRTLLATRLSQAAKGVFLYAYMVLGDLLPRLPQIPDLENYPLPDGLSELYCNFLKRELGPDDDRWYESFKPVLGLIAVAQGEGLTQTQLKEICRKDVEPPLRKCKQYLIGELPDGPFRVFHRSFADFLLDDPDNVHRHIDAATMHQQIANYYWQTCHDDWLHCDAYGLNNLAIHLDHGGQFDRLHELIDQSWMAARFTRSGYNYEGYIADLMHVWQHAHNQTLSEIKNGQAPETLAVCVHCALVRTSINSLSANYEPELVARAVQSCLWSAERALSVAIRTSSPRQRAFVCASLLNTQNTQPLQSELVVKAIEVGLRAASMIRSDRDQAAALAALAPFLVEKTLKLALETALKISDHQSRAKALAALAPRLTHQVNIENLLDAALAIEDNWYRFEVLEALTPKLTPELLTKAFSIAEAMEPSESQALMLGALARGLPSDLLTRAIEISESLDDQYRRMVLCDIVPYSTPEILPRVLKAAQAIKNEGDRAWVLETLAPRLTEDILEQGVAAAHSIKFDRYRVDVLAALAPKLTGEAQIQAVSEGLAAVRAIEYEEFRPYALEKLAPYLQMDLLDDALTIAKVMENREARALALAALVPQLARKIRTQTLAEGLIVAWNIEVDKERANVLAAYIPYLDGEDQARALFRCLESLRLCDEEMDRAWGLKNLISKLTKDVLPPQLIGTVLEQGLAIVQTLGFDGYRSTALKALAPQLTGDLLVKALTVAGTITDDFDRAEAMAALAQNATRDELTQILAADRIIPDELDVTKALAAMACGLTKTQISQTLEKAYTLRDDEERALTLAKLAVRLAGEELTQALTEGLKAVPAIRDSDASRFNTLSTLAPHLDCTLLTQALTITSQREHLLSSALEVLAPRLTGKLLTQALEMAQAISTEDDRAYALAVLAPQLTGKLLTQALETAQAISTKDYRAFALAALAPQLTGATKDGALHDALSIAKTLEGPQRVAILAKLVSGLEPETRKQMLIEEVTAALTMKDEGERDDALERLCPYLIGDLLDVGLTAIHKIAHWWNRARALMEMAPYLPEQTLAQELTMVQEIPDVVNRFWVLGELLREAGGSQVLVAFVRRILIDHLAVDLSDQERRVLLQFFWDTRDLFVPPVFSTELLTNIASSINEVCKEWNWL